jgi:plastocyanin
LARITSSQARLLLIVVSLTTVGGCGSSPSGPSGGQKNEATLTITSAGVNPAQITVAPGDRVLFVNSDSRAHDMEWDPHPDHQGPCTFAGVNPPGFLAAGQTRETGNFVNVQSCGFHDHSDPPPGGNKWTGTILVR